MVDSNIEHYKMKRTIEYSWPVVLLDTASRARKAGVGQLIRWLEAVLNGCAAPRRGVVGHARQAALRPVWPRNVHRRHHAPVPALGLWRAEQAASILTRFAQVAKTRLQTEKTAGSLVSTVRKLLANEGIPGLYRGFSTVPSV